jgi:hypothetical protein
MTDPFDRLLVQPDEKALLEAIEEVRGRSDMASWELVSLHWDSLFDKMADEAEGGVQWEHPAPGGNSTLYLTTAWWTDHQGRRHVRLTGGSDAWGRHPSWSRMDEDARPPLWRLYPERLFHVQRAGRAPAWLACCSCGATGAPEELGWMGPCCGPCHDRLEEGEELPFADRPTALYPFFGPVYAVAFSPDGRKVAISSAGRQLNLHDVLDGGKTLLYGNDDTEEDEEFRPVVFSPDGRFLAAGDPEDEMVRVWVPGLPDEEESQLELDPDAFEVQVIALAFSPDGAWLAACTEGDSASRLWSYGEGWEAAGDLDEGVTCLSFSPDGKTLALGFHAGRFALSRTHLGGSAREVDTGAGEDADVLFVEFIANESLILITGSVSADFPLLLSGRIPPSAERETFQVRLWDLGARKQRACFDVPRFSSVALTPDGRYLAGIVHDPRHSPAEVIFHDLSTGREAGRLGWNTEDDLRCLDFSPDGQTLATGSEDGVVKLIPWRLLLEG